MTSYEAWLAHGRKPCEDDILKYVINDVNTVTSLCSKPKNNPVIQHIPKIKKVVFNDPATIVIWSDNTKTIVKCQEDDIFDPEKGLAMAISKKALGNKGNYCNEIKKWLPKTENKKKPEVLGHLVSANVTERGVVARVELAATKAAEELKKALCIEQAQSMCIEIEPQKVD